VVQQVTVKGPAPGRIGGVDEAHARPWLDVDRMLERQAIALPVLQGKEEAMEMNRVLHHGVVNQDEAHTLPEPDMHRPRFGEHLPHRSPIQSAPCCR
jgi:hypothetical protein